MSDVMGHYRELVYPVGAPQRCRPRLDFYPFVTWGDHMPRVDDWVLAVGNPFGLGGLIGLLPLGNGSGTKRLFLREPLVPGGSKVGVTIAKVDEDVAAAQKGLSAGDVILQAGGQMVSKPSDVTAAFDIAKKDGKPVLLRVKSGDSIRYVALQVGRVTFRRCRGAFRSAGGEPMIEPA